MVNTPRYPPSRSSCQASFSNPRLRTSTSCARQPSSTSITSTSVVWARKPGVSVAWNTGVLHGRMSSVDAKKWVSVSGIGDEPLEAISLPSGNHPLRPTQAANWRRVARRVREETRKKRLSGLIYIPKIMIQRFPIIASNIPLKSLEKTTPLRREKVVDQKSKSFRISRPSGSVTP